MSDLILNIRFGSVHLKWRRGAFYPTLEVNSYWVERKPKPWFYIYQIGSLNFDHK